MAMMFEVTELPIRSAKFVARKQWVVAGADDMFIHVYNYNTMDKVKVFEAHTDYIRCGDKPYLIIGSDDHTAKVWDYQTKSCVQTLEGHTHNVSAVCFHPELPIIITGSEDGTVRIWHATTYRLENTLNYGLERVWAIGCMKGSRRILIGYDEGTIMVKIFREVPVASMDNSGNIIWAKHNEIQTMDIKIFGADFEVTDGERLPLAVKELGTCDLYPHSLKHNPNGRFVVFFGDGEYIIYTALAWRNRSFGSSLEFVWSSEGEYAVRESSSKIMILSKNFQVCGVSGPTFSAKRTFGGTLLAMLIRRIDVTVKNLYWAGNGDLVAIACDTSFYILKYNDAVQSYLDSGRPVDEQGVKDAFELLHETNERIRTDLWVGDCFIYNNSSWRLNYCVGGEVTTMFHLDRPMYLLGYLPSQSWVYVIDKLFNVMGYTLLLNLIEYMTLVMRGDTIIAIVAHFLESRGMVEDALEVATDPDYRFELAIQLSKLDIAKEIATEVHSESKWKQLGELAMSTGNLQMVEECMKHAMDLSSLLLLYSSMGDAEGIFGLASLSKEQWKNNVAFLCLFMLGKLEDCLHLLYFFCNNRISEAALMARSYLPSKGSEIVTVWRNDLNKVNPKAAESLSDPEEYPNLFEDWQLALTLESQAAETRGVYCPAAEYLKHNDRSHMTHVEAFGNMPVEDDPQEQKGDEGSQEEVVVVDADSNDDAVLINGNEPEEEWGRNNEGTPSS
ncbi:hypothetical protein GQ457_13G013480 [Hibiscus cannabinus]